MVVDLVRASPPVEVPQQTGLVVVVDEGLGLRVVDLQAPADRLLLVVVPLDQAGPVLVYELSRNGPKT